MRLPAAVQRQIDEGERQLQELLQAQQGQPAKPKQLELPLDQPPQAGDDPSKPEPATETVSVAPENRPAHEAPQAEQLELPLDKPEQPGDKPADPWEQKYRTLQGKFNKEIAEAKQTRQQLEQRLQAQEALLRDLAQRQAQAPAPVQETQQQKRETRRYLTEDEIREYGPDLVDVIGRRAREVAEEMVGDRLRELDELRTRFQTLDHRVKGLDQDAQSSRKARLEAHLDTQVPGWKDQDTDPLFNEWLAAPDPFSGLPRQQLLNDAVGKGDHDRIARIFLAYRGEQQAIAPSPNGAGKAQPQVRLDTLAAPARGRAVPRREPDAIKPMTEAEVATFYADLTRGRYRGREAEAKAMEERINAALMAGAIQVQPRY